MINFKTIIETHGIEKDHFILTVNEHPVWDYKIGTENTIFLISQDPWNEDPQEYVTLRELQEYINEVKIPYDSVILETEADRERLNKFRIKENTVNFYH